MSGGSPGSVLEPRPVAAVARPNAFLERRDRTRLNLLGRMGLRAMEAAELRVGSLHLDRTPPTIDIWGKGDEPDVLPLAGDVADSLRGWLRVLATVS